MGFSDKQARALARGVPRRAIRSRLRAGRELSYIEGWYVVSQANRIFGFDGWDRETVETKCIMAREARGAVTAIYSARVRITVRTGDAVIVRDGHGTGEANGDSAGEVHDRALKAAETDATKRALATFGKAFGLELYAGRRSARPAPREESEQAAADASSVTPCIRVPRPPEDDTDLVAARPQQATPAAESSGLARSEAQPVPRETAVPAKPANSDDPTVAIAVPIKEHDDRDAMPSTNGAALRSRVEKAALTFAEPHRIRDKDHLRFVVSQPCLLCSKTPSDAHHVRFAQPRAMSRKVGDDFTVPLCRKHHRDLHRCGNETAFWHDMGIDPLQIARELWEETESRTRAGKPGAHVSVQRSRF